MRVGLALFAALLALAVVGCGGSEEVRPTAENVDTTAATDTGETETGETETGETETGETEPAGEGDPEAGRGIFDAEGCGGCHVLEEAGSSGTVGPNLDETQLTYDEAFAQIRDGGGGMPAFGEQLSDEELANVTAFVVEASGGG
jgi:mono/diheme cytochrome c family protein